MFTIRMLYFTVVVCRAFRRKVGRHTSLQLMFCIYTVWCVATASYSLPSSEQQKKTKHIVACTARRARAYAPCLRVSPASAPLDSGSVNGVLFPWKWSKHTYPGNGDITARHGHGVSGGLVFGRRGPRLLKASSADEVDTSRGTS